MEQTEQPKLSRYLQAGSPIRCFLPACQQPFLGTCIRGNDGHFYCSHAGTVTFPFPTRTHGRSG